MIRDSRKFGVEIECNIHGAYSPTAGWQSGAVRLTAALEARGLNTVNRSFTHNGSSAAKWMVKRDGSLGDNGWELVSPPLKGKKGMDQLEKACEALAEVGARSTQAAGLHIHHEVTDLNLTAFKNVVTLYSNEQKRIDDLMPAGRRSVSRHTYIGEHTSYELDQIRNATSLQQLRGMYLPRYRNVNLLSYNKYGTLEFRQHASTMKFYIISQWIQMGQALIRTAKAEAEAGRLLAVDQKTDGTANDFLRTIGLYGRHRGMTNRVGRAVRHAEKQKANGTYVRRRGYNYGYY